MVVYLLKNIAKKNSSRFTSLLIDDGGEKGDNNIGTNISS